MTGPDGNEDELLTPPEVSGMTRRAVGTLASWRALGKGPRSFRLGGSVVYWRSAVEAWIKQQEADSGRGDS